MLRGLLVIMAILSFGGAGSFASAQAVQQSGVVTAFHGASWRGNGSVQDAGTPQQPYANALGLFGGSACPFGVSSQTGAGLSLTPSALFTICQSATTTTFNVAGVNGQATPTVNFNIGGVTYPFPGSGNGNVVGPVPSVNGGAACFNGTNGALLANCTTSVLAYGALCNGSTDDSAAINSAAAAASTSGGTVKIPANCAYNANLNFPNNVTVEGVGNGVNSLVGLSNALTINVNGNFVTLRNLSIQCATAFNANTTTPCIEQKGNQFLVDNVELTWPGTVGIQIDNTVLTTIRDSYIYFPAATNGACIKIVAPGGNDQIILNTYCEGTQLSQPRTCLDIQATGGVYMWRFSCLFGGIGKIYDPQAGQSVMWVWDFGGTYDTGTSSGIVYQPAGSGASIRGIYEIETWTSSMSGHGLVFVAPSGGATADDIHVINHRAYGNGLEGALVGDGYTNVYFQGGSFCGNSALSSGTYNAISFGNDTNLSIKDVRAGPCAGLSNTQGYGVVGTSTSANGLDIEGNNLRGNVTGAATLTVPTLGTGGNWIIQNNLGIDDLGAVTVASATTITAPLNPTFVVSGSTTVVTINGLWQGRKFTMLPTTGTPMFNTGGNIASACTATGGVAISGVAVSTGVYLHC
jgi:hypothetical protein